MAALEMLTEDEARHRRAEIAACLRHGEAELRARAALYLLDAAELAVLDKLDELDFLLTPDH